MNRYSFFLISALAFVFFFIINTTTFAQCTFLQPNGVNIAPTPPRPLEIVCGNLYEGSETIYDVCLVLFEGDPDNLTAYKIHQQTLEVTETKIPINSLAYGFADSMINMEDGCLVTALVTNGGGSTAASEDTAISLSAISPKGDLTVITTCDGVDYYSQVYGNESGTAGLVPICSADTTFCNNIILFTFNVMTQAIDMYKSVDGLKSVGPRMDAVSGPVANPFHSGIIPTAACNGTGGISILYGEEVDPSTQKIMYKDTTTGIKQELWQDSYNDGKLKESSSAKKGDQWVMTTYRASTNQFKIITGSGGKVEQTTAVNNNANPKSEDLSFFSNSAACTPNGNSILAMAAVNGNSYSVEEVDGEIVSKQESRDVMPNSNSGPIGTGKISNLRHGNTVMYYDSFNTLKYAQCVFITPSVPTLSEWGLIAMAGFLGLIGFMVIRRRKVAA